MLIGCWAIWTIFSSVGQLTNLVNTIGRKVGVKKDFNCLGRTNCRLPCWIPHPVKSIGGVSTQDLMELCRSTNTLCIGAKVLPRLNFWVKNCSFIISAQRSVGFPLDFVIWMWGSLGFLKSLAGFGAKFFQLSIPPRVCMGTFGLSDGARCIESSCNYLT